MFYVRAALNRIYFYFDSSPFSLSRCAIDFLDVQWCGGEEEWGEKMPENCSRCRCCLFFFPRMNLTLNFFHPLHRSLALPPGEKSVLLAFSRWGEPPYGGRSSFSVIITRWEGRNSIDGFMSGKVCAEKSWIFPIHWISLACDQTRGLSEATRMLCRAQNGGGDLLSL